MSEFYKYFKENMESLGLDAPSSLYGTYEMALARAAQIGGAIVKLGSTATVLEVIGATTKLEKLIVVSAISASYYVGAVIGSIAVATGRTLSGGTTIADCFAIADKAHVKTQWLSNQLTRHPELYNGRGSKSYRSRAYTAGRYFSANKETV